MPKPAGIKAIDCFVNLNPPQIRETTNYLFPGVSDRTGKGATPEEIAEMMEKAEIEKALLSISAADPQPALKVIQAHPDKFVGALTVNPHDGMEAVRKMEKLVKENPVIKAIKVAAFNIQKPYNDKIYYPIYAKCIELDIPITANVGIPGPLVPGECQNPIYLDEVCWFFPELKVVMTHGGEPWQFLCVKLMLKWPNLYYMTSAFVPSHYPQEIVSYMNTRGADKVMFATGYPLLPFERCTKELNDLQLRDHVWAKFLGENAIKIFKL